MDGIGFGMTALALRFGFAPAPLRPRPSLLSRGQARANKAQRPFGYTLLRWAFRNS